MPAKLLQYKVIDQMRYNGEGHIINIAKRHTNRRWRQYTPEKQCNIELQFNRLCNIDSIELKGFGTYIVEIYFKDINNELVTKLKYNFDFFDESINQKIACQQIKYVDVKLINNQVNPKRMGLNHFFMRGAIIKQEGQQSDQQTKKKKKKGAPSQIWVRQKIEGQDPWGIQSPSEQHDKGNRANPRKGGEAIGGRKKRKKQQVELQKKSAELKNNSSKKEQSTKNETKVNEEQTTFIQKPKKQMDEKQIKLQIQKANEAAIAKKLFSQKFEEKFNLKPNQQKQKKDEQQNFKKTVNQSKKQTQEQKKLRIKNQLISKLKFKINTQKQEKIASRN